MKLTALERQILLERLHDFLPLGEAEADRRRGGKTALGNGQAWSSPSFRGQWRTGKNGRNW